MSSLGGAIRGGLLLVTLVLFPCAAGRATEVRFDAKPIVWQQVERKLTFHFFTERELYTSLDRTVRMVFAAEGGPLEKLGVRWSLGAGGQVIGSGVASLASGGVDVTFSTAPMTPGDYTLDAQLVRGDTVLAERSGRLRYERREAPAQVGRIDLRLPRGMPLKNQSWPVHAGVPFPKGALWDPHRVRVIDGSGREVDADVIVRSRWDSSSQGSVRWLGLVFQPGTSGSDWPDANASPYRVEFGPEISRAVPKTAIKATDAHGGITIDTGAATIRIARRGFNVLDEWRPARGPALKSTSKHGLYLVDHEGTTYRAANDRSVDLRIEEQSAMHVVVRAAGWYVRDGAGGEPSQNLTLPTDKLCRFVTRIEAYAGKPYVRVTNTLIVTFDTFAVRLRDAGMSLPFPGGDRATKALFGVEGEQPTQADVPPEGVRGVQHLHDAFTLERGDGSVVKQAKRSAGWAVAVGGHAALAVSLRDTWQRYPKELEALPDALKLHVWPAHGREHSTIKGTARDQMHKLLFAHQGKELNFSLPWEYYFAACGYYGTDSGGGVNHVRSALYSSGLGVATTSDVMLELDSPGREGELIEHAECFQVAPHAVADPKWTSGSLALGYIHPYDPKTFPSVERIIQDCMRGYWKYQDMGEMFGMWIYRSWLHSQYNGNGAWELYRLYNGSHHHEALLPWLLYARSGDPFYLTQGMANIRQFTDVQMIHHADPRYAHREFDTGQRQVVGSTKHDNSITPWGGDHGVMGHMVCYNAPITAYYLTGDLRLREVVVDEWLNTLLADRLNPGYALTDLSNTAFVENPRNNSIAISEVIDAYQLTYDPRLLVYLAPRHEIWMNSPGCMGTDWGQSMHHELLFRGSSSARKKLMAGVIAWRAGDFSRDKPIARAIHAPQEMFALAGILEPEKPWAIDAFSLANFGYLKTYSWNRISGKVNDVFCNTGEFVLFLPRLMYAVAHSRPGAAPVIGAAQPAPHEHNEPTRVVVREDTDRDFTIYLNGSVQQQDGVEVQIFDPDGLLLTRKRTGTGYQAFELPVPRDGKSGQYVVFVGAKLKDKLYAPYTSLPEVYCTGFWTGDDDAQRYFTRSPGDDSEQLTVKPSSAPGTVLARDETTEIVNTEKGEEMKVDLGPEGVWIWNRAHTIATRRPGEQPAILAVSPERWFMPDAKSLSVQSVK